jgi:hypothetical protein
MKYLLGVCFLVTLSLTAQWPASAQEVVTTQDQQRINALIERTLKSGGSNVEASASISSTVKATVVPRPMISRATGDICDRCTDFCRDYLLKIEIDGGLDTMVYSGRNCIVVPSPDPSSGNWSPARALALTDRRSIIPLDVLSDTQSYLRQLQYLPSNNNPTTLAILSALNEFRYDAQLPRPPSYQVTEADITGLRRAAANMTAAGPCAISGSEYTACGTLN